ncbi:MAG TPA: T9SS type A sorting domain-containing protein [Bacteroidia bacterium]|nr:T9SS type A sorting domain-containing protein [Bacteroidia bacterium]
MIKHLFAGLLLSGAVLVTRAQPVYTPDLSIPVYENGNLLQNAWAGGLNAPLFSEIDLNGDGIKDLFVFDKEGSRITTYINDGIPGQVSYHYAPEYKSKFPYGLHDWVLLKDFDCDGKEDIFTYSYSGGMTVYKNDYSPATGLKFSLAYNLIYSKYGTVTANLYVSSVNLPALVDVDYDGDLDVLTFSLSGNFVEYHKNRAQETLNRCDTLIYQIEPACFGNFGLSGVNNTAILNAGCRVMADPTPPVIDPTTMQLHSGSCMIAVDIDGDHDHDLINGDILGNNLLLIVNGGDSLMANMTSQDTIYPSYDVPVNLITFPSPYYFDVNNDGNKDLIVAPCISGAGENYNNVWYYLNTTNDSSNIFSYQQNRFLSDGMIEVGSGADVRFHDLDGDGLTDMLIGDFGYFNPVPPYTSKIAWFKNTGTTASPSFALQTDDLGGFSSLGLTGLNPAFGDLDNDMDDDLILGNADGTLVYFKNTAGPNVPPVYSLAQANLTDISGAAIDVGQFSTPQLVDVNKDGKIDLLIGEKSGNINYYENTGTINSPVFTLVTASFGGVLVNNWLNLYGYSYPCLVDSGGVSQLLVGSISGYIYQYINIDGNLTGNFNLADSMYYGIYEPERITLDVADINGDGNPDILTGNASGGVTLYNYGFTGIASPAAQSPAFTLYPNPSDGYLILKFKQTPATEQHIKVTDIMGRIVKEMTTQQAVQVIDLTNESAGVYLFTLNDGMQLSTGKFILVK